MMPTFSKKALERISETFTVEELKAHIARWTKFALINGESSHFFISAYSEILEHKVKPIARRKRPK